MSDAYPYGISSDAQGRQDLLDQLAAWRKRAKPTELHSLALGAQIDTGQPAPVPYTSTNGDYQRCEPLCTHFQWPAARPRHDLVLDAVTQMTPLSVQKRGQPALRAQVYKGVMQSIAGLPVAVVVKVYQGSILEAVIALSLRMKKESQWRKALIPYKNESWAYDCMQRLQGIVVPHVYGFFEVQLPSDEPAIVMIMEYVESAELPQLKERPIVSQKVFNDLAYGMIAATHAVTSCGVHAVDNSQYNVLWTNQKMETDHSRSVPLPVFLDFALVSKNDSTSEMDSAFLSAIRSLCELRVHIKVLHPWWDENIVRDRHFPAL